MEDQRISLGELPHAQGFLVLDVVEMAALFGTVPHALRQSAQMGGRLTAIEVPAKLLERVEPATVEKALEMVAERALAEVERCRRETDPGQAHARGRDHAFFTMLWANAQMALQSYKKPRLR